MNTLTMMKGSAAMPLPKEQIYTVGDIYSLPDSQRAELIDGQIYYMAPPSRKHQRIAGELYATIREYIRSGSRACEVNIAPFAVFLNEDDTNYVEPDISVTCDPDKLNDRGCSGAPDWIIEIVSPSSRAMDYYRKLFKYRTAGVRKYWIVDHERDLVTVYDFQNDSAANYSFAEDIPVNIYPGFAINLSKLDI